MPSQILHSFQTSAFSFSYRLTHREFLKRYSVLLQYFNPGNAPGHVTDLTANTKSPHQAAGDTAQSPAIQGLKRADRRARRRRRSAYDHVTAVCRAILGVTCSDTEGNENLPPQRPTGVKLGRTKIFLREEEVFVDAFVSFFFLVSLQVVVVYTFADKF